MCTPAHSLIWHPVRPPVCVDSQPLALWPCNPTDPYPDWHGLFTLLTSIQSLNGLSLPLLLFISQHTLFLFHSFYYPLPSLSSSICHISFSACGFILPHLCNMMLYLLIYINGLIQCFLTTILFNKFPS